MARYSGPVCRLCRREGMKLFLKGDRCFTEKCAIEKRNYAPGQHGKGGRIKSKLQGYGLQLREKQKVKRLYRMQEGQFALTFDRAAAEKGVVGEVLIADNDWAVLGTTNIDNRSFEHNDEVNVAFREHGVTARLRHDFEADLAASDEVTLAMWFSRPAFEKIVGPVCWILERQQ